jgi:hypothetical protein
MERNCKTVLLPSVNSCDPGRKCHALYSGLNGVDARCVATTGGRRLFWIVIISVFAHWHALLVCTRQTR